jgi:membrane peptidoglycan carboxypeptidase
VSPSTIGPYFNCQGQFAGNFNVVNAEGNTTKPEVFTLYNGTTQSINVFYAHLEQKVGLCNVVKTAISLGMTYANGASLLRPDKALGQDVSADNITSFTLGSVPVSPMSMAAAYATVAARGMYCTPIAIGRILSSSGASLPVKSAGCHRVLSTEVADAANHILQGVLVSPGTASDRSIGVPAAGKTGTSNGGYYAAFAGYTPRLAAYVSVFNPIDPTTGGAMLGYPHSCFVDVGGGQNCPGQMFGDNAPAATWEMTFMHADLGNPPASFVAVDPNSPFFSLGDGVNSPKPAKQPKPHPTHP